MHIGNLTLSRIRISAEIYLTPLGNFAILLNMVKKYILEIKGSLYLNIGCREHCPSLSIYIGKTNEALKKYYLFY